MSRSFQAHASNMKFEFGENWKKFANRIEESQIFEAQASLTHVLQSTDLAGKRFLDVGSGSGLLSLAASRLGAEVHSFDIDLQSVEATLQLKQRYSVKDSSWHIEKGSALDGEYIASLGTFDIVYCWGVLHHTGAMWKALQNISLLVAEKGILVIAIYNDQGRASQYWLRIKEIYNWLPSWARFIVLGPALVRLWGPTTLRDFFSGQPFHTWMAYGKERGMAPWRDVIDWVGGYPFEVAKPEGIFEFYHRRGFVLINLKTCAGGRGCNEFVFQRGEML